MNFVAINFIHWQYSHSLRKIQFEGTVYTGTLRLRGFITALMQILKGSKSFNNFFAAYRADDNCSKVGFLVCVVLTLQVDGVLIASNLMRGLEN